MKKLLLLLVGVFVALSANADLWVVGSCSALGGVDGQDDGWDLSKAPKLELKDGYYTFFVPKGVRFQLSTLNNGSWDGTGSWKAGTLYRKNNDQVTSNGVIHIETQLTWHDSDSYRDFKFNDSDKYVRVSADYSMVEVCSDINFGVQEYTVYFYDKENISGDIYAYIWQDEANHLVNWGTKDNKVKFTKVADRYIKEESNYYPVYKLTFTWDKTPNYLIVYDGSSKSDGSNKHNPNDLPFVNNGFYTNDEMAATGKTVNDLVAKEEPTPTPTPGDAPTTLYFHVKYDTRHSDPNVVPMCHVYNTSNINNGKTAWNSEASKMTKVDEVNHRYSLWKYELTEDDVKNYNAVVFHFPCTLEGNVKGELKYSSDVYRASGDTGDKIFEAYGDVPGYDKANWTKYIYSSCSEKVSGGQKEFAVQTYLTYEEFQKLDQRDIDNGGRRHLYLIGWDMYYFEEDDNYNPTELAIAFPSKLVDEATGKTTYELLELTNDGGCFFLPVKADSETSSFKISWINVKPYADVVPESYRNSHRAWATFDLGLIGVDKEKVKDGTYDGDAGPAGKIYCKRNVSVPYMNYNQADWVMKKSLFPDTNYWLVIDTHVFHTLGIPGYDYDCKTATITSFNPQPSVKVNLGTPAKLEGQLPADVAESLHDKYLYGAAVNGTVIMDRVNYESAKATITATNISDVKNSDFERTYAIYFNDVIAAVADGATTDIDLDFIPLSKDESSVAIRAMYHDKNSGNRFHSRTGHGTFETTIPTFAQPAEIETLIGKYVRETSEKDENGMYTFGVYVEGMTVKYDPGDFNGYADFEFKITTPGYTHDGAEIVNAKSAIHTEWPTKCPAWTAWPANGDWSTALCTATDTPAPVFLHNVAKAASVADLPELEISCKIYAVYPFIYNPNATITPVSKVSSRAPSATGTDFTGFKVSNTYLDAPGPGKTFTVTKTGAIAGVDDVAVDASLSEDVEAEYFTLSGIRVYGDPAPGIYIRRQGATVTKVVIR